MDQSFKTHFVFFMKGTSRTTFFFFFFNLFVLLFYFIYLFWLRWVFVAARGLFSGCRERGLLFLAVRGLHIAVASLFEEHGL